MSQTATRAVARVTTPEDLPTGPGVGYHVAPAEDAEALIAEGIDNEYEREKWADFNVYLEAIAAREHVADKPDDRSTCAFAYTGRQQGTAPTTEQSGYVTLAIDLQALNAPLYAASYWDATMAFAEFQQTYLVEALSADNDAYEAAVEYWESLESYNPAEPRRENATEVLIEGPVRRDAITHILR